MTTEWYEIANPLRVKSQITDCAQIGHRYNLNRYNWAAYGLTDFLETLYGYASLYVPAEVAIVNMVDL